MNGSAQKRPWLAALLTAFAVGLGHLYLRRWRRALGWLFVLLGTSYLVGPATVQAYVLGDAPAGAVLPLLVLSALATVDAYVAARAYNARRRVRIDQTAWPTCPNCRRSHDPDLDFCQWCGDRVEAPDDD
ncbi:zinc ribbon domain-containing protein [Halobacterium litoreum]|uniref:Zinc ribbon domain-containing protein n=1 Tax=Halobacterium litoreum TaxID=2039234 RepID=A0ABD5NH97_9EURY|nr:zinc ribbon domain-containing protein [Halobacterium litoreum]UHH12915.1 zinc ribbon domain-containing protein [Halobacterium litoreum]